MLMECAREVGLDLTEAKRVLENKEIYKAEILQSIERVKSANIHAIPLLVFEVKGVAKGNWLQNTDGSKGREIYQGSGNSGDFRSIIEQLHADCTQEDSGGGGSFPSLQLPDEKVKAFSKF